MQVEDKILKQVQNDTCTGCGACFNVCPKNAITMRGDEFGFYKPVIDNEKCVNCGLCEKVCPIDKFNSTNENTPKVFALQINDEKQLYKSASGGAFAVLAKEVIRKGGVIYGVIYDDEMKVCHSRTETLDGLEKMYSSKYVQSNTKTSFKQAKEDLENEKTVLFSGTPCQIAGLKSFLKKDYENLLTADLVCHGTPSPLVFEKYKKEIAKNLKRNEQILNIDFRSKVNGWNPYCLNIKTDKKDFYIQSSQSIYTKLFLNNLSINDSCLDCQFNGFPRVADVTIGDFWGVDEYDKLINDNKGLSVVLLNSAKGEKHFDEIKKGCFTKDVPLDFVVKHNQNIVTSSKSHPKRTEFFEDIKRGKTLQYCVKKYCREPLHKRIYRFLPQIAKDYIKHKILNRKNDKKE